MGEFLTDNIKTQEYFLNMGPQHPATHGVLRLLLKLDGEIIDNLKMDLGYVHRSIEKMCEHLTYPQIIHLTDRLDYLSSHMNNEAVALCVENALGIEVPDRVKVIRTLMSELTRIASHALWFGVIAMDIGAITPFMYGFRERELINDIMEETCGARLTMNYNLIGGVRYDLHPNFQQKVKAFIKHARKKLPEYDKVLSNNIIFKKRLVNVGTIDAKNAVLYGLSGPTARGSGVSCDIRKIHPYSAYDKVEFNEITFNEGDSYARYRVRIKEMWESLSILEQLVDNIPEGDFRVKTKAVIKLPAGEYYQKVESARGEFGVYIKSSGDKKPYRVKFRSPNFANLSALTRMAKGFKIADLVAILSTIDIVVPDIDR